MKAPLIIDARMQHHAGIGTYLRGLLYELKKKGEGSYRIGSFKAPIYSLQEQVELSLKIPPSALFWSPHYNVPLLPIRAKKKVVTIHDIFPLVHPLRLKQRLYAKSLFHRAVSSSDWIITISEFTKKELLAFFPKIEKKLTVIPCGNPGVYLTEETPSVNVPSNFFLFVGSLKPHKNLSFLLTAFEKFLKQSNQEMHLVIVGKMEGFINGIDTASLRKQHASIHHRLHFLGKISDAELTYLYKRARALIFPSLYEGWGLPPIEAMHFGCPVLASSAASIPEACGSAALYFNPYDGEDLYQKMLTFETKREQLTLLGFKRIKELSWKTCAEKHWQVFEKFL